MGFALRLPHPTPLPIVDAGCVRCFRPGQQQLVFAPWMHSVWAADEVRSVPVHEPALSLFASQPKVSIPMDHEVGPADLPVRRRHHDHGTHGDRVSRTGSAAGARIPGAIRLRQGPDRCRSQYRPHHLPQQAVVSGVPLFRTDSPRVQRAHSEARDRVRPGAARTFSCTISASEIATRRAVLSVPRHNQGGAFIAGPSHAYGADILAARKRTWAGDSTDRRHYPTGTRHLP